VQELLVVQEPHLQGAKLFMEWFLLVAVPLQHLLHLLHLLWVVEELVEGH
jgi:hypothetical protein